MIKAVIARALTCLICVLVAGLLTGIPGVNPVADAQNVNAGLPTGAGYAALGRMTGDQQVRMMSIDDLSSLMKSNADFLLVDARQREQYAMAHIPGAISLPLNEIPDYAGSLDRDRMIITCCGNYHCPVSTKAATELTSLGFTNIYDYKGGIKEWQETGHATATGSG